MKKLIRLPLYLALTIAFISNSHAEKLNLGGILCLANNCLGWGVNTMRGMELATEEVKSVLGREIEWKFENSDEASNAVGTVTAYRKLRTENISLFVGPSWSNGGKSLAPIAAKDPVVVISPTLGIPDFNEAASNLFNTWPHDFLSTEAVANYLFKRGIKSAAVIGTDQAWELDQGKNFSAKFKDLGGKIVAEEFPLATDENPRTSVQRIINAKPEAIFVSTVTKLIAVLKLLRSLGYTGPMSSLQVDEDSIKTAGKTAQGLIYARYPDPSGEFVSKYQRVYGSLPGIGSSAGYDTAKILFLAIERANSVDPLKVQKALLETSYIGAQGETKFDAKRGVLRDPVLYVVENSIGHPLR